MFFYRKRNENRQLGTVFFVHNRIVPAVKRVEFVSDRMSYRVIRGRRCNITVLNVRVPSEEKIDYSKDNFYEELKQVFDHFLSTIRKFCWEIVMQNWGRRIFSNRQLGMVGYIWILTFWHRSFTFKF